MKIHIVKKGDTLYNLSKKYGVSLDQLIALNPQLSDPNQLAIGMKIKIPSTPVSTGGYEIVHKHVVKEGDTLWKLAKAWGVPLQALIASNPQLKNPNILLIGQIVNIPKVTDGQSGGAGQYGATGFGATAGNMPNNKAELTKPIQPQPVPQQLQQPMPQPISPPVPQVKPQPMPQPLPQPLSQAKPQPMPQPLPQPVPQAKPQQIHQPLPQSVPQAKPQQIPQPLPQSVPQAKPQSFLQPLAQGKPQPTPQPFPQPIAQGKPQPYPQPLAQGKPQPMAQSNIPMSESQVPGTFALENMTPSNLGAMAENYPLTPAANYYEQSQSNAQWQSEGMGGEQYETSYSQPYPYSGCSSPLDLCNQPMSIADYCCHYPISPYGGYVEPYMYQGYGGESIPYIPYNVEQYGNGTPIWSSNDGSNSNAFVVAGEKENAWDQSNVKSNSAPVLPAPTVIEPSSYPGGAANGFSMSQAVSNDGYSASPYTANMEYGNMPYNVEGFGGNPYGYHNQFCQCGNPYRENQSPKHESSWLSQWGDVGFDAGNTGSTKEEVLSEGEGSAPTKSRKKRSTRDQQKNVSTRSYTEGRSSTTQAKSDKTRKSMPWING